MRIMAGVTTTDFGYEVWMNGNKYDNVIAVDTEQGFMIVQLYDRDGKSIDNNHGGGQIAILYGDIGLRKSS